ncbi:transferrin-binding protein-like solute binding protein [Testudinibacter sp. TR-2022]|uniref:transferrin-binding protein-like solute binding protein n=1 Tax=Testudinibacter sp. TR-2022 TaxID=2585029 RepID=UPI001119C821|nr:transferrin-binding protein-like solute binding protein [Testudinibacter sp. TR-2022]TNH06251.1 hypothetical protein FHQ30_08740 [Pasteurellaceae bacterium Phil11]TNH21102.1 hypothetical protein FHQ29_10825 [Testudinibacter sp. TR-2022]TNH22455.1 hypothetical protein FHQ27_12590 [Testudinibacter sp. TR-2022]
MKKQQIKFGLTALSLLVLTACGGGGGSSSSETAAPINPTSSEQPATPAQTTPAETATTQPATPATPTQPAAQPTTPTSPEPSNPVEPTPLSYAYHGKGFQYTDRLRDDDNITPTNVKDISVSSNDFKTIIVDGKTINIVPSLSGINTENIILSTIWQSDRYVGICCGTQTNIKSVKLGFSKDTDTGVIYAFYNGSVTPDSSIPASGSIAYHGDRTAQLFTLNPGNQGPIGQNTSLYKGSVDVIANFDTKKVNGELYSEENMLPLVSLVGDIDASQIAGTATLNFNEEALKNTGIGNDITAPLNGAFFGEKAEEIAGEAHNAKWGVVFAAEQQK